MKTLLKILGALLLIGILALVVVGVTMHESKPTGTPSAEADAMAQKMLAAIDKPAWDTTAVIQWTFKGMHDFLWDKNRNFVEVKWEDMRVLLHTKSITGQAFKNGTALTGDDANAAIQNAWSFFCNDSFWLNAPAKAFDPGTSRSIVQLADGREGLMVAYSSGGVTPGDSYVWLLDETGLPTSYKMWVKIIPVGGMEFTWQDWETLPTGAKIAKQHINPYLEIPIENLKAAASLEEFGLTNDPFAGLN